MIKRSCRRIAENYKLNYLDCLEIFLYHNEDNDDEPYFLCAGCGIVTLRILLCDLNTVEDVKKI